MADHAARYLAVRRALGYKMSDTAPLLESLLAYVEGSGRVHLEAAVTLQWAAAGSPSDARYARRLSVARRFAVYVQAFDPATEIAPKGLGPEDGYRRPPHISTDDQVAAMVSAAGGLDPVWWSSSVATAIGLAACCGLRPAEIYRLKVGDVDLAGGRLAVMHSKGGRSRLLPVHATTITALARHLDRRDPAGDGDALLVTAAGRALTSAGFTPTFRALAHDVGVPAGRARPGDLRHTFAVNTLTGWHRQGADVGARLPALSAYLGHARPDSTYWYLEAVPELMAVTANRVAAAWEDER